MDATYGTTNAQLNQPQHAENRCSLGKAALIGLGIILMIGGAVAAGVLYSHQGYVSLSYLAAIPVGIALIVIGARIRTHSSQQQIDDNNDGSHRRQIDPRFASLNNLPWEELVKSQEKLEGLFPMESYNRNQTQQKLRALDEKSLGIVGQVLDLPRLLLLDNSQLKDLPWEELVKSQKKLEGLFPMESYNRNQTQQKLRALDEKSLGIVGQVLNLPRLLLLDNSQLKDLPWEELVKSQEKLAGLFPMESYNRNQTQKKLRALDEKSLKILASCLSGAQLNLLVS